MKHRRSRITAAHYTPASLASFLASPLIDRIGLRVLDPSFGDGALLAAAYDLMRRRRLVGKRKPHLQGCDIRMSRRAGLTFPSTNLVKTDFFKYPIENKFDLILMNPPFVRHHSISESELRRCKGCTSSILELGRTSDFWAYFLLKATAHLRPGGSIGAILPWSILQARFAVPLRKFLASKFKSIHVVALGASYFDSASERVVALWLRGHEMPNTSICLGYAQKVGPAIRFSRVSRYSWMAKSIAFAAEKDVSKVLSRYISDCAFVRVSEVATIRIGIVTGCNGYFIRSDAELEDLGFSVDRAIGVVTSSAELHGLRLTDDKFLKRLVQFNGVMSATQAGYLKLGVDRGYDLRSHSLRRTPWYKIDVGNVPDAFFPYRVSHSPHLVLNSAGAQCTNSVHRIYFGKARGRSTKAIQISLLSTPGQLSLEALGKCYGDGVLKIEPGALADCIVNPKKDGAIDSVYGKVSALLDMGRKLEAVAAATEYVNKVYRVPKSLASDAARLLEELRSRRLRRTRP